jgi:ribosomal protein S12 methylthiotransferase
MLAAAGHVPVPMDRADVVIVNTCGFIDAAKEESIETLLRVCAAVHAHGSMVAAVGCLVERYRAELARELPEIDLLCGFETQPIVALLDRLGGSKVAAPRPQRPRRPLVSYLKISDGCDRRCTFCAIPLIKGRYEPTAPNHILQLAHAELRRGARELVLVGQDTASYRMPGYGSLQRLLRDLAALKPLWLRVLYLQPESVSAALLEALAAYAVPYVDLPLQHASERVLRAMRRGGNGETYLDLLEQIRRVLPGVAVRSTFITGFPGETEGEFEELSQFVAAAGLAVAGIFPFDPQEGTAAARLPRQVPVELRAERAARLGAAAESASRPFWEGQVGRTLEVLIEHGCHSATGEATGRIAAQAPDVDGVTYVSGAVLRRGQVVPVTVDGVLGFDLTARIADALPSEDSNEDRAVRQRATRASRREGRR